MRARPTSDMSKCTKEGKKKQEEDGSENQTVCHFKENGRTTVRKATIP